MAMKVGDAMTPSPRTVQPSSTVVEAAQVMKSEDVGIVPIAEGDRLTGVVTDRDITIEVVAERKDPESTTVGAIASSNLVTVDPDQDLDEALRLMAQHQVRRLPVCEEDGRLVGILAQADVAEHAKAKKTGEVVERISQ
jgi:CBS domain-containing protein